MLYLKSGVSNGLWLNKEFSYNGHWIIFHSFGIYSNYIFIFLYKSPFYVNIKQNNVVAYLEVKG